MRVFREYQKNGGIHCCFVWANEASEFSLGGGSSSSISFLVEVKYRAEITLKIVKIVKLTMNV